MSWRKVSEAVAWFTAILCVLAFIGLVVSCFSYFGAEPTEIALFLGFCLGVAILFFAVVYVLVEWRVGRWHRKRARANHDSLLTPQPFRDCTIHLACYEETPDGEVLEVSNEDSVR